MNRAANNKPVSISTSIYRGDIVFLQVMGWDYSNDFGTEGAITTWEGNDTEEPETVLWWDELFDYPGHLAISPGLYDTFPEYWIDRYVDEEAVTDMYLTLFATQMTTGTAAEITKIAIGTGVMAEGQTAETMTALVGTLATIDIEEVLEDENNPFNYSRCTRRSNPAADRLFIFRKFCL